MFIIIISILSFLAYSADLSIIEVENNEIHPPKALITNGAMMSNLGNKCGDFCYKDEKYYMPAGTVILFSSV